MKLACGLGLLGLYISGFFGGVASAETIRGGNNTFSTFLSKGKNGKLEKFVRINRRGDVPEIIQLSKEVSYSQTATDVAALNAYLNSGRALEMPTRFKGATDFMYFKADKVRKIEASITDTLARTYISNLRQVASDLDITIGKFDAASLSTPVSPRQMAPPKPQLNYNPKGAN